MFLVGHSPTTEERQTDFLQKCSHICCFDDCDGESSVQKFEGFKVHCSVAAGSFVLVYLLSR